MRNHLADRILHAIVFGVFFAIIGLAVPSIYFRYFDTRNYYRVEQPVALDKQTYEPCDNAVLKLNRSSDINFHGNAITEIVLIRVDGGIQKKFIRQTDISIPKGDNVLVIVELPIDCETKSGEYFFQGTVSYEYRGADRAFTWKSELFTVAE